MAEQRKDGGALWENTKGDMTYWSGKIEIDGKTTRIAVFKNENKKEDKHPDYNIAISDKQPEQKKEELPDTDDF